MNNKWLAISLGGIIGLSHIGMIGMLSRQQKFPVVNLPVGPYTSYQVEAGKNGYRINYRANDPKVMHVERDIKKKGGFLGLGNNTTTIRQQYTMDGSVHLDGGGVNPIASTKSEACIEAIGAAKGTGKLVGTSMGAAAAPAVSGIPFIGWVAAGWIAMFGGDQGASIGGNMAEDLNKNC